jgi:hypothetical protein
VTTCAWVACTVRAQFTGASSRASTWCSFVGGPTRDVDCRAFCAGPDGNGTFVLVRSEERGEKAMHQRFAKRIEDGLHSLERHPRLLTGIRVDTSSICDPATGRGCCFRTLEP